MVRDEKYMKQGLILRNKIQIGGNSKTGACESGEGRVLEVQEDEQSMVR